MCVKYICAIIEGSYIYIYIYVCIKYICAIIEGSFIYIYNSIGSSTPTWDPSVAFNKTHQAKETHWMGLYLPTRLFHCHNHTTHSHTHSKTCHQEKDKIKENFGTVGPTSMWIFEKLVAFNWIDLDESWISWLFFEDKLNTCIATDFKLIRHFHFVIVIYTTRQEIVPKQI